MVGDTSDARGRVLLILQAFLLLLNDISWPGALLRVASDLDHTLAFTPASRRIHTSDQTEAASQPSSLPAVDSCDTGYSGAASTLFLVALSARLGCL